MSDPTVVIVGGGQAGFETASNLRTRGWPGAIKIICDERELPYQRPPLSKAYLTSSTSLELDEVVLRPNEWFKRNSIDLLLGSRAEEIDRVACQVVLDDGFCVGYDHLVLATGARNRVLPIDGADLRGVHYLRTLGEAAELVAAFRSAADVAVVGAGFIGLEVAAAAAKKGLSVTVLEATDRPMARAVSQPISDHFTALHTGHGVALLTGTGVTRLLGEDGRVTGVETAGGRVTPADLVVVGIGVVPEDSLASIAGLEVQNGVLVDEHLRTSDPRIFAVGDCAVFPAHERRVRLESVQNAVDHARCVAAQLTGTDDPYRAVPWFWTEQFESKLQMAGLIDGHRECVVRGDPGSGAFSVFCFSETGELLGVESVNQPRDHMAARRLLASGHRLTARQVADPRTDLKALSRA